MKKSKPEKQLEELIKEIKVVRVKAVTIRQYVDTKLTRKSNHQLGERLVLGLGYEGDKITLTIEGTVEGKGFNYSEDVAVHTIQQVWSHGEGCYDIQCAYKGSTINISITTA
jgi:ribosomal protein S6E (S10)